MSRTFTEKADKSPGIGYNVRTVLRIKGDKMLSIDTAVLNFIYEHFRAGWLDFLMPLVTWLGQYLWFPLAAALLISRKYRKAGLVMCAAILLDVIFCNGILKPLVARVRPFDTNTAVQLLISPPTDFSFPSGHTALSFSAASALYFSRSRLWIPAAALAFLVTFSRLYLYVHYPTDVLCGMLLGIVCGFAGKKLMQLLMGSRKLKT